METNEKIYEKLINIKDELQSSDIASRVQEKMPAAELHAYYNQIGLEEGWLKKRVCNIVIRTR